ncbi:MAG TPA: tetratricopeptide repeat protein, partial [Chloroflexia bacterium]|nr:tetratricopeptide repeat protein [Chloroflexia bacterium]
ISTGMGLLVNLGRKRKMQLALRREAPGKAMPAVRLDGEEEERLNLDELGGVERRRKVRLVLTLILITVLILVLPGVMAVLAIDIAFDRTTNFFSGFYLFGLAAVLIPLVLIVFLNIKEQKARKQLEARVEANELQSQVDDLPLPITGSGLAARVTGFGLVIISVVLFVFTPTALQGVLAQAVSLIDRLASNPAGSVVFGLVFAALAGILLLPALLSAFVGGPGKLLKRDLGVLAGLALRLVAVYTLIVFVCHLVILATVQPGYVQSLNGARGDQLGFTAGITAFGLLLAGIYLTPYLWVKAGWNSGDYPTALRRSLFLRKLTVEGSQAARLYSETLLLKGSYLEGESFTRGILRLYRSGKTPLTPAIIVHLGLNLAGQGRYYEAVEALENALRLNPKNGRGYSSLAGTYLSWGREPERARKLLEQGCSRCKYSLMVRLLERRVWGEILANQAWALVRLGRSEEAWQKLSQALGQGDRKMQPALAMLHYYGSQVKEVEGEIEGARQDLEEALRLDPDGAAGKLAAQRLDNAG